MRTLTSFQRPTGQGMGETLRAAKLPLVAGRDAERRRRPIPGLVGLATVVGMLAFTTAAPARTILLTDEDCEKMACITQEAPRSSWAAAEVITSTFSTATLEFYPNRAFLIRYPIERIPKGQKIIKAELAFITTYQPLAEQRLHLRRIVGEWGAGVCWQYRLQRPKKVEWSQAGARGISTDRATKASAVIRSAGNGEKIANVTEDVELWYTGAASNHGWMLSLEDNDAYIRANSPLWPPGRGTWKLRITYEPE